MIRRQFADWQLWLRGQIVELEDYTRQIRTCAELARDADKQLKGVLYKVLARYIEAYTDELREDLRAGTRKHDEREYKRRHTCEKCGDTAYTMWTDEDDGKRLCTRCAMKRCHTTYDAPRCAYCGKVIDSHSDSACCDMDNYFCGTECALRYHGFDRDGE